MKALGRELTICWMTWSTMALEKASLVIERAGDALALQGCRLDEFTQKRYDRFATEQNDYVDELEREVARESEHEFRDPQHGAPANPRVNPCPLLGAQPCSCVFCVERRQKEQGRLTGPVGMEGRCRSCGARSCWGCNRKPPWIPEPVVEDT